MNTRTQQEEILNQALHELALSSERGEPQYVPTEHGWRNETAFRNLTRTKEARRTARGYRITLLGLTIHRRIQAECNPQ